ncbi:hypothetical protein J6590_032333 [Homalodisca vitripennis]|nr:hypothetical protein J6590_032333 [Homalodisca vitripennis]
MCLAGGPTKVDQVHQILGSRPQQDSYDWACRQREDPPWNGRPSSAVGPTETSLRTTYQHEAAALQNDSSHYRDIRGSSLVSTHLQDDQKASRSLPNRTLRQLTNTPWFVRNTVVLRSAGLPSLHEYITGQARAMYAAAAESP